MTTIQKDIARHIRLLAAYDHIVRNDDPAAESAYHIREDEHFAWCLGGTPLKNQGVTYFERSPYASIEISGGGFILHNHVTGKQWPFKTYQAALEFRGGTSNRYAQLERGEIPL
jgi:hypothetical protein